ncbi:MAG: hypothetical protein ACRD1X_03235 [Vicinamibacteria bacterium]
MQEGEDKEAFLAVFDEATGKFLPVPPDIGRYPVFKDGKESFCWMAVHTHLDTHGTLHLAVDSKNHLYIKPVLEAIADRFHRPITSFDIYTNGQWGMTPIEVEPGMHIKVVLRKRTWLGER